MIQLRGGNTLRHDLNGFTQICNTLGYATLLNPGFPGASSTTCAISLIHQRVSASNEQPDQYSYTSQTLVRPTVLPNELYFSDPGA